jgi:hypothetical protein
MGTARALVGSVSTERPLAAIAALVGVVVSILGACPCRPIPVIQAPVGDPHTAAATAAVAESCMRHEVARSVATRTIVKCVLVTYAHSFPSAARFTERSERPVLTAPVTHPALVLRI